MKPNSTVFFGVLLTVTALAAATLAQSPQVLPGCEPVPEVRKSPTRSLTAKISTG